MEVWRSLKGERKEPKHCAEQPGPPRLLVIIVVAVVVAPRPFAGKTHDRLVPAVDEA
jgi:hypothetical protein